LAATTTGIADEAIPFFHSLEALSFHSISFAGSACRLIHEELSAKTDQLLV